MTDNLDTPTLTNTTMTEEWRHERYNEALYAFNRGASSGHVAQAAREMEQEFEEALCDSEALTMRPNHPMHSHGNEQGIYLVVDLGGLTLRVGIVEIHPPDSDSLGGSSSDRLHRVQIHLLHQYNVDNNAKKVDKAFFGWMADCVSKAISEQSLISPNDTIKTGITWSFALQTRSFNRADICFAGKGYQIMPDVFGQDLKTLLEHSVYNRHGLKLDVRSIMNDSLAVYAAGSFLDASTRLALVLGTGLNMCATINGVAINGEGVDGKNNDITTDDIKNDTKDANMQSSINGNVQSNIKDVDVDANKNLSLYNMEMSLFGSHLAAMVSTKYDEWIDSHFCNPSAFKPHLRYDPASGGIFQPSELMTLGRYLPELVRMAAVDCDLFAAATQNDGPAKGLLAKFSFPGHLLCLVSDCDDNSAISRALASHFDWDDHLVDLNDVVALKLLVDAVIRRAAFVVATCIVALLKLLARRNGPFASNHVNIAYVGSVLQHFKRYRALILSFVNECHDIMAMGLSVDFRLVDDSLIVGAAIAAAHYA